jgi:DNA recombination protein RmuC
MRDHFARVGGSLGVAVRSFNDAVGSFQSRVMPTARRFRELGVGGKQELRDLETVEMIPRELESSATNGIPETSRGK